MDLFEEAIIHQCEEKVEELLPQADLHDLTIIILDLLYHPSSTSFTMLICILDHIYSNYPKNWIKKTVYDDALVTNDKKIIELFSKYI